MQAFKEFQQGCTIFDVVLELYLSLNMLPKLISDNSITDLNALTTTGQKFAYDTDFIYNEKMSDEITKKNYKFRTGDFTLSKYYPSIVLNLDAGNIKSYSGTGTLWKDLSEYVNNGTLINGPTFNSANGGSIVFDGIDDYVVTPTVNLNSFEFTMNMWFKYSSISTTEKRFLLDFRGTTENNSLFIYITPSNKLVIDDRDGALTSDISAIQSISAISPNTWINLSVTVNRNLTGGNEDNIYINGVLFASTYVYSNNLNTPYASNPFYIGNNSLFNSPYKGNIASVQVYNRALLEEEILQNFNSTKARYGL